MDSVFICKSLNQVVLVLVDAFNKIRGNTNVEGSMSLTCQNVNVVLHAHPLSIPARKMRE